eukprot:Tbor_TRINITY_DN2218_c0_g1::TRINITY_DN2218_c0_g1_i1::g.2709::m.2709
MPPLFAKEARKIVKANEPIPGQKFLHRGIHIHRNEGHARTFKTNLNAKRSDPTELMVHHQKIQHDLQDIYARTTDLHKDNMTMEERIEAGWKAFERIGGKRPQKKVGYATHLSKVSSEKKEERQLAAVEMSTSGETFDYNKGSALHRAKDRRVKNFVTRQLKRAHLLKRYGDPTPINQSGRFDDKMATLNVFKKTMRKTSRESANEARTAAVKGPGRNGQRKTMWDIPNSNPNINRPNSNIVKYTTEFDVGRTHARKGGKKVGRKS